MDDAQAMACPNCPQCMERMALAGKLTPHYVCRACGLESITADDLF